MPPTDRTAPPLLHTPPPTPEDLLARAGWFRALALALAAGERPRPPEAPKRPLHARERGETHFDGNVLDELRLQSALLEELEALPVRDRDALVDRYFHSAPSGRAGAGESPQVEAALARLRGALDRRHGGRERWLAALPSWALEPSPLASTSASRGGVRLDRWSRGLLGGALLLVVGFGAWSLFPRGVTSAAAGRPAPLLQLQPVGTPASVVEGTLRVPGMSFAGWRCWLAPAGAGMPEISPGFVREDGTFRLETSARGEFELQLQDVPGAGASHRLVRKVKLDGTTLRYDLAVPTFQARGGDESLVRNDLVHVWSEPGGWSLATRIHLDERGRFMDLTLPTGASTLSILHSTAPMPGSTEELSELPPASIELEQHY